MEPSALSWLSHVAVPMLAMQGDRIVAMNPPAASLFACAPEMLPAELDTLFGGDSAAVLRGWLSGDRRDTTLPLSLSLPADGERPSLSIGMREIRPATAQAPALRALTVVAQSPVHHTPGTTPGAAPPEIPPATAGWVSLLPAILDRLPVALLIETDDAGHGVFVNRGFVDIFEYELADIAAIEDWWVKLYPDPDIRDAARLDWAETLARTPPGDRTISTSEFQVRCGSGVDRIVQFHSFRIGAYRVHSYVDVSARHQATADLRRLADTDALTGIANRRSFFRLAEALMTAATPAAALLMDIDHFKAVNDRLGHAFGDRVLTEITARLRSLLRPTDIFGRLGGEEFGVLLPGADALTATLVAERLRLVVAETPVRGPAGDVQVTLSIGVSCTRAEEESIDDVLARADLALYAAKDAGRNRVHLAGDRPASAGGTGHPELPHRW